MLGILLYRIYWLYEHKDRRHQGFGSSDLYGNNIDNVKITEGGKYFDLDIFQVRISCSCSYISQNRSCVFFKLSHEKSETSM